MTTTALAVLGVARSQIGSYYPGKSKYGVWYDDRNGNTGVYDSAQFCAMGLSWCFAQVDGLDIFPEHAYTPSGVNWFKANKRWTQGLSGVRVGDIVFFDFPGLPNRVSHVGIVESVNGDGSVNTIEFNTSGVIGGSQTNGRAVVRKRRKSGIVGYGRPSYGATSPTAPPAANYNPWGWSKSRVRAAQVLLAELGYNLGPSGIDADLGKFTSDALRDFQGKNGLVPDGSPGSATMAALNRAVSNKAPKPAKVVEDIQWAVGAGLDGKWGNDTDKRTHAVRMASALHGNKFPYGVRYTQEVIGTKADNSWGGNSARAHDEATKRIQRALKAHGYYTGDIDGKWGPGTDAAFVQAWRDHALTK